MLPLFGPSTVRDAAGLPLDIAASPAYAINEADLPAGDHRAADPGHPLAACSVRRRCWTTIALDKYSFVRDAFLSRRLRLVFDGNPPEDYEIKPPAPAKAMTLCTPRGTRRVIVPAL